MNPRCLIIKIIVCPSIRELKLICKKGSVPEKWQLVHWGEKVNRAFTIYLTWFFVRLPITPDQITVLGTVVTFVGFSFFLFDNLIPQIIGLIVIFISFLLDGCDGEVARYRQARGIGTGNFNLGGIYIEPVSHDIQYAFIFLPIGLGRSLATGSPLPLIAAFLATSTKLLFRLAECRYDAFERSALNQGLEKTVRSATAPQATIFYFLYRHLFTSSMLFYTLAAAVALRHVEWFLYFYATGFLALWAYKTLKQRLRIKRLIS